MFRKQLLELLLDNPMTVPEMARAAGHSVKEVTEDLQHLIRSLKHTEWIASIQPSLCRKCGFEFSAEKLRKPSRCPSCHGTWLTDPRIEIRKK